MEKILLAIDSQNLDTNTLSFACYLALLTNSRLTGIFLENLEVEEEVVINQSEEIPFIESISIQEKPEDEEKVKVREGNMNLFKSITEKKGVQASIHLDKGIPAAEIISETRFADILIIDAATSFSSFYDGPITRFVKDLLHHAECPVVISPENFEVIDSIVFCYNGSKSSVFAIKQFTYLFPELRYNRAKIIFLSRENEESEAEVLVLAEWLRYYYTDVEFLAMEKDATEAFFNYLLKKKNDFVVMGAYGRGLLASFFENNAGETEVRTTSLPIFVAHY